MADIKFGVRFDGQDRVSFVQGEDRVLTLTVKDLTADRPISMTGANLAVHFPKSSGGTVKRRSAALVVPTLPAPPQPYFATKFTSAGHGFVTGDEVQVTGANGGAPPAPLLPATTYTVSVLSADQFSLISAPYTPVVLTETLPSTVCVTLLGDLVISAGDLGEATLELPSYVTDSITAGLGQPIQVVYSEPDGMTRIFILPNGLDVSAQPLP